MRERASPPHPFEPAIDLAELPGFQIRRLQQIAVAAFLQEAEGTGITPVQFAVLQAVATHAGLDQRSLARQIALDTSTVAGVVDRLEARGLIARQISPADRRVRLLALTPTGQVALDGVVPAMQRAQARILAPLATAEQQVFMRLLRRVVEENNTLSRAPVDA
jgi:MarR family transcriptional regulator, lower aerobic nicotinate degradation pathway regulator